MPESLDKHILKNEMVILGEPMEAVGSVAFGFMLPAGASRIPDGCCGAGSVIIDWIFRGAGDKDSKQLCDALDGLGLHRAGSVSSSHITIGASLEASNLKEALDLYASIILEPALDAEQFELARSEPDADKRNSMLKAITLLIISEAIVIGLSPTPEGHYWWPWIKNYYGEATVTEKSVKPVLALAWIDQDLKAEMGY